MISDSGHTPHHIKIMYCFEMVALFIYFSLTCHSCPDFGEELQKIRTLKASRTKDVEPCSICGANLSAKADLKISS